MTDRGNVMLYLSSLQEPSRSNYSSRATVVHHIQVALALHWQPPYVIVATSCSVTAELTSGEIDLQRGNLHSTLCAVREKKVPHNSSRPAEDRVKEVIEDGIKTAMLISTAAVNQAFW